MVFKNIQIDHFRGIEHLEVKNLGNVNVFLGQNNGGKTTLLEAVFLLSGMSNPVLPERINAFRNKGNSNFNELRYLFHRMQMISLPTFQADMADNSRRRMTVSMAKARKLDDLQRANQLGASSTEGAKGETCVVLDYELQHGNQKSVHYKSEFCVVGNGQFTQTVNANYQEPLSARFISSYSETNILNEEFSNLVKTNRKEEILALVRLFDTRITNLEILFDGIYVKYDEMEEMLPLTMCGEGLKKFINIIVTVANGKNNVLLIDEIDNGVHFSAYPLLWRSILLLARQNDMQLFITTHSIEVVQSLSNVLQGKDIDPELRDDTMVFTIATTAKEGMQSYRYGADDIRHAIDNHIELRS